MQMDRSNMKVESVCMHSHAFEWPCKCQVVTDTKSHYTSHIFLELTQWKWVNKFWGTKDRTDPTSKTSHPEGTSKILNPVMPKLAANSIQLEIFQKQRELHN